MHLYSPADVDDARRLLASAPLTLDTPTHRRHRSAAHLDDTLASGRRRPEWVWAVSDVDGGPPLGVVAALGSPSGEVFVLDLWGLPADPALAEALVAHASDAVRALGAEEAGIFAPPGALLGDDLLSPLAGPLRAAGWRLLVERRHYEFDVEPGLSFGAAEGLAPDDPGLSFVAVTGADDPRLRDVHREVMRGTLDAHDAAAVERLGFEAACAEGLAYLLDSDPVECLRLVVESGPDAGSDGGPVVGMVSGRVMPGGRAFVLFVGVAHDHRGRGLSRRILTAQTRALLADGATVLIADTDETNTPMAAAFAAVGWRWTEERIDLVPG